MELLQSQVQHLSQQQLQSVELLQMSAAELEEYLHNLAQENPVVELDDSRPEPERPQDDELLRRLKWLDDNDRQNRYYQHVGEEELDPLARIGTEAVWRRRCFASSPASSIPWTWMRIPPRRYGIWLPVWMETATFG